MISERQVAKSFDDLWRNATPLLRPNFVAMFNTAYREPLLDTDGGEVPPVESVPGNNPSVVAELGFIIASKQVEEGVSNTNVRAATNAATNIVEKCKQKASERISKYNDVQAEAITISEGELEEAFNIAFRYELLLGQDANDVNFLPLIPGAGIVNTCEADLATVDCLWEVKAVRRNIGGKDIRQLLVYLALNSASGEHNWTHAGIFNPRLSQFYKFEIEHFIGMLSGGKSSGDVFHEMISYFSSREIQIDTKF